nr:MAG TPA: hypothetical protein [Caudoviricetes sp.]
MLRLLKIFVDFAKGMLKAVETVLRGYRFLRRIFEKEGIDFFTESLKRS